MGLLSVAFILTRRTQKAAMECFCSLISDVSVYRPLEYERVYLPLCRVADTPFHIQGNDIDLIIPKTIVHGNTTSHTDTSNIKSSVSSLTTSIVCHDGDERQYS